MKNICFFNTTPFLGGGEKKHLSYALAVKALGYNVVMVVGSGSPLEKACIEHNIPYSAQILHGLSMFSSGIVKELKFFFEEHQIDTVFFNGSKDVKVGAKAAFQAQVPRRIYWRGIAVAPSKSWLNKKVFGTYVSGIITNSEETKNMMLEAIGKYFPANKIRVVYNGIDFGKFDQATEPPLGFSVDRSKFVMGNASRLTKQKNLGDLIKLAVELKNTTENFEILIAGKGELEAELKSQIEEAGVGENVRLVGFTSSIRTFMQSLDLLVFPSLWEGFGFTMVEAMACGVPVVGYRISSNPEIVDHENSGLLVDPNDFNALVEAVKKLMKNGEYRERMGQNAREYARSKFTLDQSVKQLLNCAEGLKHES